MIRAARIRTRVGRRLVSKARWEASLLALFAVVAVTVVIPLHIGTRLAAMSESDWIINDDFFFLLLLIASALALYSNRRVRELRWEVERRARAERALQEALGKEREVAGRLRSLDETKNAFLTAVSHELRTPLSVILGNALTLERVGVGLSEARGES